MKTTFIVFVAFSLCLSVLAQDKPVAGKDAAVKAYAEGRYADAVRLFAAELAKEEAKPKPDWVALSYLNDQVGNSLRRDGQYDKALEFLHKSLAIDLKNHGKNHLYVAIGYNNIEMVHDKKGDSDKALEFYHKSLAIFLVKLGKDHLDVAKTYNNIGIVHRAKAEYDKALEFYHKSLAIDLVKLGKDHPSVGLTYYNMALTYGAKKNVIKEKELLRKAYAIQLKKLGKDHPDTKKTARALASP